MIAVLFTFVLEFVGWPFIEFKILICCPIEWSIHGIICSFDRGEVSKSAEDGKMRRVHWFNIQSG